MTLIADALARLGISRLVLSIHQTSFPAGDVDLGAGTPYSDAGRAFLAWVRSQGFTGVALGPAGITSVINRSPYDGTIFSTNPMFIDPIAVEAPPQLGRTDRVEYQRAYRESRAAIAAYRDRTSGLDERVADLRRRMPWLDEEARYEGIAACHGDDPRRWPERPILDEDAAEAFRVGQVLLDEQHARTRETAQQLGLNLYADAQIGISHRDRYLYSPLFLERYRMGAPPSRTNPEGQPWGYPVLDPRDPSVRDFLTRRFDTLLARYDGVRIDHPHGWVCPWVYEDADDALYAVQHGARLHESPDLVDHPRLASHAYVRAEQLDRALPRHADNWVRFLEEAQIDRYASSFDLLVERAAAHGVDRGELVAEVLSTCPRPLAAVLARHGLGRFRVTQKADVTNASDVYRSDNAAPADWIMVGNHDTAPLRRVVEGWSADRRASRAAWLGQRLKMSLSADDRDALALALVAELFVGPAQNVLIFWPDLFGLTDIYNRAGIVHPDNWTLRVPRDYATRATISLARALAIALRARGSDDDLATRLEQHAPAA